MTKNPEKKVFRDSLNVLTDEQLSATIKFLRAKVALDQSNLAFANRLLKKRKARNDS